MSKMPKTILGGGYFRFSNSGNVRIGKKIDYSPEMVD